MSNTQFIFINKEDVPTQEQWQISIDKLNLPVRIQIDKDLTPFEDEGFIPCIWGNSNGDVGFEIFYEVASDACEDDDELLEVANGKDYCISMCWGGEIKDCLAVLIASCALASSFNAIVSYEGENPESVEGQLTGIQSELSKML